MGSTSSAQDLSSIAGLAGMAIPGLGAASALLGLGAQIMQGRAQAKAAEKQAQYALESSASQQKATMASALQAELAGSNEIERTMRAGKEAASTASLAALESGTGGAAVAQAIGGIEGATSQAVANQLFNLKLGKAAAQNQANITAIETKNQLAGLDKDYGPGLMGLLGAGLQIGGSFLDGAVTEATLNAQAGRVG